MKTIEFNDNGLKKLINPLHITDVKLTKSEYGNEWCIVISYDKRIYTKSFNNEETANKEFEYIKHCLDSITN